MSHIADLISHHCPNGVEEKLISDVATLERGKYISKKTAIPGDIPVIAGGRGPAYWHNEANRTGELLTVAGSGAYAGFVQYWDSPIFVSDAFSITTKPQLKTRFLYHWLKNQQDFLHSLKRGSGVAHVYPKDIAKLKIPVPPLEVQAEIVRILDSFTNLEANLQTELEARRQQYDYCKDKLLSFSNKIPLLPLSNVADIGTGSSNTNEAIDAGKYPFFVRSQEPLRKNDYDFDETAIITAGDGVGVGKVYHYVDGKYALHQRAYRIHINTSRVCPKFFFHYMKSAFLPYIEKTMYHGSVPSIRRPMLNRFPVPVPPLEEQERIVGILDKFDALVNDLSSGLPAEIEARRKQYEYYRDRLLTFTPAK